MAHKMTRSRWIQLGFRYLVMGCLLAACLGWRTQANAVWASEVEATKLAGLSASGLGFAVSCDPPFNPQRPSHVEPGDFITYTLLISNSGAVTVNNITLTNAVPLGTHSVANRFAPMPQQMQPIVWKVAAMTAGQAITLQHVLQVEPSEDITVTAIVNIVVLSSPTTSVLTRTTVHPFGTISAPKLAFYLPAIRQTR